MQTRPTHRLSPRQLVQYLIYALFLGAMLVGALNDPNPIWWWVALVIGTGVIVYAELRDPTITSRPPTAKAVLARTTGSSTGAGEVDTTPRAASGSREG